MFDGEISRRRMMQMGLGAAASAGLVSITAALWHRARFLPALTFPATQPLFRTPSITPTLS
jgi:hypothetical protein